MDSNLHIEEYIDFNRYWQVLKRRWVPATITFAGILTLSLVAALASEDVYQAEAQLLIKSDRSSKLIGIPDGSPEIKGSVLEKDPIETEAKILQSRPILERVIKELDLKSKDGKPLTYKQAIKSFTVNPIIGTELLQVNYEDPDPDVAVAPGHDRDSGRDGLGDLRPRPRSRRARKAATWTRSGWRPSRIPRCR